MQNPFLFITGCAIVGWLAPEIVAGLARHPIPAGMNLLGMVAGALIAASFV